MAEPIASGSDGPFASIARARDAIRQLKAAGRLQTPVEVVLRGGTYHLYEPFVLQAEDSGTPTAPVVYAAFPGEKPILSGGRVLKGWKPYRDGIWSCSLEEQGLGGLRFRQLFYHGQRQTIARWPNRDPKRPRTGGFLYCEAPSAGDDDQTELRYPLEAFPRQWTHLEEVEVVIHAGQGWHNPKVPIERLDPKPRVIKLSAPVSPVREGNRFHIQNALEELDAPGEWYLDTRTETVYFWPPDDELESVGAVVPVLDHLVRMEGDVDDGQFVEHVTLSHLGLECCEGHGVVLEGARHAGLVGCTLRQVGGAGVAIGEGSTHCRVAGNDIAHPGGHAIAMHGDVASTQACTDNVITNNYAHHCGGIDICSFGWGSGICIGGRRNVVSHNLVHDTAYSAITFTGYDHLIEYNHVHHACLECWDGDGIYGWVDTKGGSGGSVIRFNHVHDIVGYGRESGEWRSPSHALGVRCDDYLSHTLVRGNLVYRCGTVCICLHGGWDNTVENNVMVDGGLCELRLNTMRRDDPLPSREGLGAKSPGPGEFSMSGNMIRQNIMCSSLSNTAIVDAPYAWEDCIVAEMDRNLIWNGGRPLQLFVKGWSPEKSWEIWRKGGRDARSVIADPGFIDPDQDDYALRPDSPAFGLGFQPLPLDRMGLVGSFERASWPVVEPEVVRDPPTP